MVFNIVTEINVMTCATHNFFFFKFNLACFPHALYTTIYSFEKYNVTDPFEHL